MQRIVKHVAPVIVASFVVLGPAFGDTTTTTKPNLAVIRKQFAQKDATIATLQNQLAVDAAQIADLEKQIAAMQGQVSSSMTNDVPPNRVVSASGSPSITASLISKYQLASADILTAWDGISAEKADVNSAAVSAACAEIANDATTMASLHASLQKQQDYPGPYTESGRAIEDDVIGVCGKLDTLPPEASHLAVIEIPVVAEPANGSEDSGNLSMPDTPPPSTPILHGPPIPWSPNTTYGYVYPHLTRAR